MSTIPSTPLFDGTSAQSSNLLLQSTPISSTLRSLHVNQKPSIIIPSLNEFFRSSQSSTPTIRRPVSHYTTLPINSLFNQNNHPSVPASLRQSTISNNFQTEINCDNSIKQQLSTTSDVISNNNSFEPETEPIKSINHSPKNLQPPKTKKMFKCKINQFKKLKATYNILLLIIFISCVSIAVSTLRIDSFLANLPKSPERVANNQRHQFEYGFWTMAFVTTLFHLMISTTLLIICLIHLYCAYSITKNIIYPDEEVLLYLNSTAVWRNIMAYFYLVSLMFSIITNTCFIFVIPTNIGVYSKGTILATGAFLCLFILFVAFHTLFKWCKIIKEDEEHSCSEKYNCTTYSPISKGCDKIDINSLSTLV